MFTLFIFVFIVTPGRVVKIQEKKSTVNTLTLLDQVNTFTVLEQVFFVVFL